MNTAISNPIELVIFDLDGTLIDSAPGIVASTNKLITTHGYTPLPAERITRAIGEGLMELIHECFPAVFQNESERERIGREFYRLYKENMLHETTVFPGVFDFLSTTAQKVAIVTNKYEDLTHVTLKALGLERFPWIKVFGADSLAERKPSPLPLFEVMRAAGVTARQTVMVGDGLPDMEAARRAGVHSIGCTYGYCAAEKLQDAGATTLIQSAQELPIALDTISRLAPRNPLV
ncbi:MAG: HAD-IA family hydrolase [Bdellovibrionales bacterium]|nr:HAD-IA family hydrolase [Bdellovibrionales bacterium]